MGVFGVDVVVVVVVVVVLGVVVGFGFFVEGSEAFVVGLAVGVEVAGLEGVTFGVLVVEEVDVFVEVEGVLGVVVDLAGVEEDPSLGFTMMMDAGMGKARSHAFLREIISLPFSANKNRNKRTTKP